MMNALLFAETSQLWYALPLIVTISLVYGATRHELMKPILQNALRFGIWVTGFMVVLFAVLFLIERAL